VTYARERSMERAAVVDERALLRDALRHTMCEARLPEIKAELEKRIAAGDLVDVPRREGEAGRAFTTARCRLKSATSCGGCRRAGMAMSSSMVTRGSGPSNSIRI